MFIKVRGGQGFKRVILDQSIIEPLIFNSILLRVDYFPNNNEGIGMTFTPNVILKQGKSSGFLYFK